MAREDLYAARLKHRWVAPPLQQVVQHLVLGESTIVHQALRHIDRVRRAPPTVAPALVGGTGVARARHLVPLHPVEVTREPGARGEASRTTLASETDTASIPFIVPAANDRK